MRILASTNLAIALASGARADDLTCLSTTFRVVGANDKVCVSAFDDPKVPGVTCHISQARTGGLKGTFGLAEEPLALLHCVPSGGTRHRRHNLAARRREGHSESTSLFFKHTHVFRIVDKKRNTLVYVAISDRVIEGSPQNSITTVPVLPWPAH